MTLQEIIETQGGLAQKLDLIIPVMGSPPLGVGVSFFDSDTDLANSLSSVTSAIGTLPQPQQDIVQLCSNIDCAKIGSVLNDFSQISSNLVDSISLLGELPYQSLLNSLSVALEQVKPYLPPDEKEQRKAIIKPLTNEKPYTCLTLSDALSILNILLSVLFFVLGSMPDGQAERIIQQQNKIIANQETEIAQLHEEDQALSDTLDTLSDSINLLTDEIKTLCDKFEDSEGLLNSSSQANPGESQQDNSDAQN